MVNGFENEDYEYQKEQFNDRLTDFIRKQSKYSTEEIIEKLKIIIEEYSRFYNDNDNDKDMIDFLKKDLEWFKNIEKSKVILKKKVEVKEQQQIKKDVTTLQFKYKTSLWRKLFNERSFHNEIYGQALMHVVIGVICDIKVSVKKDQYIWARPSLFLVQRSRSGKNEGMYFVENVLKVFQKKILKDGKVIETKPINILRVGTKTDPTMLDRYVMESKKGLAQVKTDGNGKPVLLKGSLTSSDLVWYPEANYLLNPTGQHNQEAINIHLNLLETDGTYTKELEKWGGLSTKTKGGNYALVAVTRPIEDIKKHIIYNGLLQRCEFMPRHITRNDRKIMLEMVALHAHSTKKQKQEYKKDFNILIKELEKIQDFALKNPPEIKDEESEIFKSELYKKLMYFENSIQKECSIESNKDIFDDFIANYTNQMLMIAYQSAPMRRSKWVELVDLEYAFNYFKQIFELMKPWVEESIETTRSEKEKQSSRQGCLYKLKQLYKTEKTIKVSDGINFLKKDLMVSYPTAKNILEQYSEEGPMQLIRVDWDKKEIILNI